MAPQETVPDLPVGVWGGSRSLQRRCGSVVACCRLGDTDYSSTCMGSFEGGRHYLLYLHHSLVKVNSLSRVQLLATPWTTAHQALHPWDFPGKSTGVGCHCLLLYMYNYMLTYITFSFIKCIVNIWYLKKSIKLFLIFMHGII